MKKNLSILVGILMSIPTFALSSTSEHGVSFLCSGSEIKKIEADMEDYLESLKIESSWVEKKLDKEKGLLVYTLNTPEDDFDTLNLNQRAKYKITDEEVMMPVSKTESKKVKTVSRKEIVLALFQHGRETQFTGHNCSAESFIDHVGVRQNTVLWAQKLEWQWPDGGPAFWNKKYWNKGTPHSNVSVVEAFMDMFLDQKAYGIGCYTATKMVMVQGVLDYYNRVKMDPDAAKKVMDRLMSDKDPLVGVEPRKMWSFEKDFDMKEINQPGKILVIQEKVAPKNFVPGDWAYFLNTDPVTWEKTGYEGSNAIYLGGAKFDDYYNDHNHSYTYKEKLDEVYQWRNGVFSRSRDKDKIKPVTPQQLEQFGLTPEKGGLVMEYRVHHEFFN